MSQDVMLNAIRRDLKNKENVLKKQFAEVEQNNKPTVPENIFVFHFLPLFSGESTANKESLLENWYLIAGTPYHEVNVINESGEVVAVVPPILNRKILPIKTERDKGADLDSMFKTAIQNSSLHPNLGNKMIISELSSRFLNHLSLENNAVLKESWDKLLSHYGKSLAPKETTMIPIGNASHESDFEYE